MRKLLAIALTLCMLLTSVVIVSAEDVAVPGGIVKQSIVVSTADDKAEWESGEIDTENKTEGASSVKFNIPEGKIGHASLMPRLNLSKTGKSVDVSGTNYFTFDIYVTDAATFNALPWCLELTSAGIYDKEETAWTGKFKLVDGWNTVRMPLADFTKGLDYTRFNYMRLFNTAEGSSSAAGYFCLDNLRFEVFEEVITAEDGVEKHIFRVFEEEGAKSEAPYLVRESAGENASLRFADAQGEVVYKFSVANRWGVNKVTFIAKTGAQLLLQVSQDDVNWTTVYEFEMDQTKGANQGLAADNREYDLTSYVDLAACADIYIRVADAHPAYVEGDLDPNGNPGSVGAGHGWGGALHIGADTGILVEYTPLSDAEYDAIEAAADERSISFLTCSNGFGAFQPNKENKVAGASSLMMTIGGGQAPSTVFATPVDGTGYDALEFELYVSDLALFDVKFGNTQLELTSSGACDQEEIGWNLATIKECIVGEPQAGWNHVVLYFSEAVTRGDNPFDITRINFFRFFMVQPEGGNCDMTVGIDNLRLTKAGAERDAKIAAENQAAADKVIQRIDKIGEVTIDSARAIEKAESEFEELTRAQKELVTNYDVLTAARAKYDELKAAADAEANKPADEGTTDEGTTDDGNDDATTGDDDTKTETPDDGKTETPDDEKGGSAVIIIVVVAVVVVAAVVVVILLAKKKNKK